MLKTQQGLKKKSALLNNKLLAATSHSPFSHALHQLISDDKSKTVNLPCSD